MMENIPERMLLNDYQEQAMRTNKWLPTKEALVHGALGMASEAGELATAIKAHVVYGKELDRNNVVEELGDLLWFLQLTAITLGVSLEQVAQANITKLRARYPNKYSDEAAIARADKAGI